MPQYAGNWLPVLDTRSVPVRAVWAPCSMGLASQIDPHWSSVWREGIGQIGTWSAVDDRIAPVPCVDVLGHRVVRIA